MVEISSLRYLFIIVFPLFRKKDSWLLGMVILEILFKFPFSMFVSYMLPVDFSEYLMVVLAPMLKIVAPDTSLVEMFLSLGN